MRESLSTNGYKSTQSDLRKPAMKHTHAVWSGLHIELFTLQYSRLTQIC